MDIVPGADIKIDQAKDLITVTKTISQLYISAGPPISDAARLCYQKDEESKSRENVARTRGIYFFKALVLLTAKFPKVENEIKAKKESSFTDINQLIQKLDTADLIKLNSVTIQSLWLDFSEVLIKAGLIQYWDMAPSTRSSWKNGF